MKLKQYILRKLDVDAFYQNQFPDWKIGENVHCFNSENHSNDDAIASMSIGPKGEIYCHACGMQASSPVGYWEERYSESFKDSMHSIFAGYIEEVVPKEDIESMHQELLSNGRLLDWLDRARGIDVASINMHRLGYSAERKRLAIPIFNKWGIAINVRYYSPKAKGGYKLASHKKGMGKPRWFPIRALQEQRIVLCEGELDAIITNQYGITATTLTAGVRAWPDWASKDLAGKDVIICYDVNDKDGVGQKVASDRAKALRDHCRTVKVVELPIDNVGGDLTDYFVEYDHSAKDFKSLVMESKAKKGKGFSAKAKKEETQSSEVGTVHLADASKSEYYNRRVAIPAMIAGKDTAPFMLPKTVIIKCDGEKRACDDCIMDEYHKKRTLDFREDDSELLNFVRAPEPSVRARIKKAAGVKQGCSYEIEIKDVWNAEEVKLIPSLDYLKRDAAHVARIAYVMGHGIETNRNYILHGVTLPDPRTQHATHMIDRIIQAQDQVETFELDGEVLSRLKAFAGIGTVKERIEIVAEQMEEVTKIVQRPDLHVMVDLVMHSVLRFEFNGEMLRKGWLTALVIGDTRTGKTAVMEALVDYYGFGEIISAENCTYAGLVGGLDKIQGRFSISWGALARQSGRFAGIDEMSSLTVEEIGRLSRVLSEGIAEINKIQTERTHARTRTLWCANSRSGRAMLSYANGVEAVGELIGNKEDIARFDMAMVLAQNEVPSERINQFKVASISSSAVSNRTLKDLLLWSWSREPEQIKFTEAATKLILSEMVPYLSKKYHADIPLIQAENLRHKLARIAAAVAARSFNASKNGEKLIVNKECVRYASYFLDSIYSSKHFGYHEYSRTIKDRSTLASVKEVDKLFAIMGPHAIDFVEGMLELRNVTITDVADYLGSEKFEAKELIGKLVRLRAMQKYHTTYIKRPAFIDYLKAKREELQDKASKKRKKRKKRND